jgi:hypothetical protein
MEMNCEHCDKEFSSKSSLNYHQKTAKYCLEKQGKKNENFKCYYCDKMFTTRQKLTDHQSQTCKTIKKNKEDEEIYKIKEELSACKHDEKIKYEQKLSDKESYYQQQAEQKDAYYLEKLKEKNEYISKLEAKLEKLESAVTAIAMEAKASANPVTTNNTTNHITVTQTNNVLNLSKEHVNKVLTEHLNYDVVYAGQAGFAKFVVDKMLKGPDGKLTYKCVDPSRQMFEFIDESGETVRDMRAEKLIQSLLDGDAIKIGLDAAAKGWNTDDRQLNNDRTATFGPRVNEYTELNRHNTVFRNKVSSLTT